MNHDDLDQLLGPSPAAEPQQQREAVWQQSYRQLRRQKWHRDLVRLGGYVVLLVLGVTAGWLVKPQAPSPVEPLIAQHKPPVPAPVEPSRTAQQLELDAERSDDLAQSARLYRAAGDGYLEAGNDIRSALRCYRQHLDLLGEQAREVALTDSWLLLSLKRAQNQGVVQ